MNVRAGTIYLGHAEGVRSMRERTLFSHWAGDR